MSEIEPEVPDPTATDKVYEPEVPAPMGEDAAAHDPTVDDTEHDLGE